MPKHLIILLTAAFLCKGGLLFSQEATPYFIFDYARGQSTNYFSKAPNALANHQQMGLGKTLQLSAEHIIKGRYGIGLQLLHTSTQCKNAGFSEESNARLSAIPDMQLTSTAELFALNQTSYLLSGSYLLHQGRWHFQFKLGAGVGLTGYGYYKTGFVEDSTQSILGFGLEGYRHQFVIDCRKALTVNSQLNVRYIVYARKKLSLALFAGLGYGFQRTRFEYIQQKWRYNVMKDSNSNNQTLLIWRQYVQQLSFRVGISIILNKKVD